MKTMEEIAATTIEAARPRSKNHAVKVGVAVALGAALISSGVTQGGWHAEESIAPATTITAGSLDLQTAGTWSYRGVEVTEAELDTLRLVPGDVLTYDAVATVGISGDMRAELAITGGASTGSLLDSGIAEAAWEVDGAEGVKTLTQADDGTEIPVSWTLEMAPVGDPAYTTGAEGQLASLDLDEITVSLTQVAK